MINTFSPLPNSAVMMAKWRSEQGWGNGWLPMEKELAVM